MKHGMVYTINNSLISIDVTKSGKLGMKFPELFNSIIELRTRVSMPAWLSIAGKPAVLCKLRTRMRKKTPSLLQRTGFTYIHTFNCARLIFKAFEKSRSLAVHLNKKEFESGLR